MAAYTTTSLSSVTCRGITWNFSTPRPCWQFPAADLDGERSWGVQLPVTIVAYSPAASGTGANARNGGMLNPIPGTGNYAEATIQGFTGSRNIPSTGMDYDESLNYGLALPLVVTTDCSLCNAIATEQWEPEQTDFREFEVLTCLAVVPEAGSFRPPYAGTDKTIRTQWNTNTLNFSALQQDAIPPSSPADWPTLSTIDYLVEATARPLLDINPATAVGTKFKAARDAPHADPFPRRCYGAGEIAPAANNAGMALNANFTDAQKRQLLWNMCQWAIDTDGIRRAGGKWFALGGHNCGRKIVVTLGAAAMQDSAMLAGLNASLRVYNEDQTHSFITQLDIDTPRDLINYAGIDPNSPLYGIPERLMPYTQSQLGMADWGFTDQNGNSVKTPQMSLGSGTDGTVWHGYNFGYRAQNAGADITACYITMRMGLRSVWNNEAEFRYIFDRAVPAYLSGLGASIQALWQFHFVDGAVPDCVCIPSEGVYSPNRTIRITNSSPSAEIYWNLTGAPTKLATPYTSPIITSSQLATGDNRIYTVAYEGDLAGSIKSFLFRIDTSGKPAQPNEQSVSITSPSHTL